MLFSPSIKHRFAVSVTANLLRALCTFLNGVLLARVLDPSGYGDMGFLLGSFAAYRSMLDMGTSNAFYTFIARQRQPRGFYCAYFVWLALQFAVTALGICLILPGRIVDQIWIGHSRGLILLAFTVAFFQQPLWQSIGQIGEATRRTAEVQLMNIGVVFGQLLFVVILLADGRLTLANVFIAQCLQYTLMCAVAWRVLSIRKGNDTRPSPRPEARWFHLMLTDYGRYCRPLIVLSVANCLYDFADKWLLQRSSGARQQGLYQIGYQFATISLLATTSLLNIFWKEIAEAKAAGNTARVAEIYRKASRGLIMVSAAVSGLLVPWSREIVGILLGASYLPAAPILSLMFLYPIHQSMGQIGGTMLLAGSETAVYTVLCLGMMLVSIPSSFLLLAPPDWPLSPGLSLGGIGLAMKVVLLNILSVNVMACVIARRHKWRWDWRHQIGAISCALLSGYCARLAGVVFAGSYSHQARLLTSLHFAVSAVIYLTLMGVALYTWPSLIGVDRAQARQWLWKVLPAR